MEDKSIENVKKEERVNIYDFDKTIYRGNSTVHFFLFCLINCRDIKKLYSLFKCGVANIENVIKYKSQRYKAHEYSKEAFQFITIFDEVKREQLIEKFWEKKKHRIKDWYLNQKRDNDVIMTASPDFLIKHICDIYKVNNLVSTEIDKETGIVKGLVCVNEEKIRKFKNMFPDVSVEGAYTDDPHHDKSMLDLSDKKYVVKGKKVKEINEETYNNSQVNDLKDCFWRAITGRDENGYPLYTASELKHLKDQLLNANNSSIKEDKEENYKSR